MQATRQSWRKNDKRLLFYFTTTSIRHLPCYIIHRKNQTKINITKYIGVDYGRFWWMRNDRIQRWLANDGKNRDISGGKRVFLFLKISYYSNMTIGRNT